MFKARGAKTWLRYFLVGIPIRVSALLDFSRAIPTN